MVRTRNAMIRIFVIAMLAGLACRGSAGGSADNERNSERLV